MHTCGIKTDGTVACWGDNTHGQSSPFSGPFTQVSAGGYHTCGVKPDGTISCWGDNIYGQSNPPSGTFIQVSAGGYHTCGLRTNGSTSCWGGTGSSTATPPSGSFIQISTGYMHTCGMKISGAVTCWGANYEGQSTAPSGIFTQVGAGGYHTCGLRMDGTVACWGDKSYQQSNPPPGTFTRLGATGDHTCGVRTDGTVACWGMNDFGQAPSIGISPSVLPDGIVGYSYSQVMSANGSVTPYSFKIISGSLPPGFTLSADGTLSGAVGSAGAFSFTIEAVAANNFSGSRSYLLTLKQEPSVTLQPTSSAVCAGSNVSFTSEANEQPVPSVQWQVFQVNTEIGWTDIIGAPSTTYTLTASNSTNGYQYRAVFTSAAGTAVSDAATLSLIERVRRVHGNTPAGSYCKIQDAFNDCQNGDIVELSMFHGFHNTAYYFEDVDFDVDASITLKGGLDATFTSQTGYSTFMGTLVIRKGTVIIDNIVIFNLFS